MIRNFILGNKSLQKFWWTLYKISLKGLNYDRGHVPGVNGEVYALNYALNNSNKQSHFTLFDVGANRGQYLTMALRELNKTADYKVYCFEPQNDAYNSLLNVAANNTHVISENMGLGSAAEKKTLYKNSPQSETGSLHGSPQSSLAETVVMDTLDSYCAAHQVTSIDFLKIDTEGHELEVLKGAKNLLANNCIRYIQFEFGVASIDSRIYMKDFFTILNKYDIYRILPKGLQPIKHSEYHEIFLTTNYLSILKTQ
jgi:FkbM family methyltransferase